MSKENVKLFYEKLKSDKEMAKELQGLLGDANPAFIEQTTDIFVKFAAKNDYIFTGEDIKAFEADAQELTTEELEQVNAADGSGFCLYIGFGLGKGNAAACKIFGVGFGGWGQA